MQTNVDRSNLKPKCKADCPMTSQSLDILAMFMQLAAGFILYL